MQIDSNSFLNGSNLDVKGTPPLVVPRDSLKNSCIFTEAKKKQSLNQDVPEVKNAKLAQDPLSTQAQTQANTVEESNKIALQYIKNLQKDFGLTKKQAVGITANLWHESAGMNAGINQGGVVGEPDPNMDDDNKHGYGIAQWGGVRKQGLLDYAKKNGIPASSDAANYGYLKQELKGKYNDVIKAVKKTDSIYAATAVFENKFEHATEPNLDSRLAVADKLMEL